MISARRLAMAARSPSGISGQLAEKMSRPPARVTIPGLLRVGQMRNHNLSRAIDIFFIKITMVINCLEKSVTNICLRFLSGVLG
jgi:hypothetical protein